MKTSSALVTGLESITYTCTDTTSITLHLDLQKCSHSHSKSPKKVCIEDGQAHFFYHFNCQILVHKNVIFTLMVVKLVLISVPTIYLSYCYNLIATHKMFGIQTLGPSEMVAMSIVTDRPIFMGSNKVIAIR